MFCWLESLRPTNPFVYESGIKKRGRGGVCLLIIDPQIDFVDPSGSLKVDGAVGDMERLAEMIENNLSKIDDIVVTMDAHMSYHISHPNYWVNAKKEHPGPFTEITYDQVKRREWMTTRSEDRNYALTYLKTLEKESGVDKVKHTIWPEHCLIGSLGQTVYPRLYDALQKWENDRIGRTVKYVQKGNDARTEMYSVLEAEIPVSRKTYYNHGLANYLTSFAKIIVTGEAASHCVNSTITDLLKHESGVGKKLCVVRNMMSAVPSFENLRDDFLGRVEKAGGHVANDAKEVLAHITPRDQIAAISDIS